MEILEFRNKIAPQLAAGKGIDDALLQCAKLNGYIIMYGYSDDLVEVDGALHAELDAYAPIQVYVNKINVTTQPVCTSDGKCHTINAEYSAPTKTNPSLWKFTTDIPHVTFDIMEGRELFCRGIIFDLNNLEGEAIVEPPKYDYDTIIVGGGAGGLFAAYEFVNKYPDMKIAIFEAGAPLQKRKCPIDGVKVKSCIQCPVCSITAGIGGAGAFSDGKFNITTDFGGTIHEYIGKEQAIQLMEYVDSINMQFGGEGTKIYPAAPSNLKREALQHDLHIMDANIRHLGTEKNYHIIQNMVRMLEQKVDIFYHTPVLNVAPANDDSANWVVETEFNNYTANNVIIATGRSGSKWTGELCKRLGIDSTSTRVDIGIRFECPAEIWEPITDAVYESKILYRSPTTGCTCRTFCMNPHGSVVSENTHGIVTVNGHSFEDPKLHTNNTNFALLVTHKFTEPFKDSNAYGEYVAKLVNMLAGGVMVQRFGDLLENKRTNDERLSKSFTRPTLSATPGNLALCLPKQTLDTIIDTILALDKLAPGTANYDNLLYGAEVKFYNSAVEVDSNFESCKKNLYFIGDCSGTTHSLSQAAAAGVHVARVIGER